MGSYKYEIKTIDTHTVGEVTRIVVDGFPEITGNTMMEKKSFIMENYDHIRKLLMNEPRGHKDMFGAIIVKPANKQCDIGVIFMDSGSYLNMCGHGTIGTVTMCLNRGLIERKDRVLVDTPSGIIECFVHYNGEYVESVEFKNVPAFVLHKDLHLEVDGLGPIQLDIAFGGSFFAIVNSNELNIKIDLNNKQEIIKYASLIRKYINTNIEIKHPFIEEIKSVDLVEISEKIADNHFKNVVVFGNEQIDRSPCGTGTCAKMATLSLDEGETIIQESIIGSKFIGKILDKTNVGDYEAIIPTIQGSAWIIGEHKFMLHSSDIYPEGFVV
ncbi:proline racemase [Lysinibacillus composti]|uniref:Proline racemase n=1 Tax=Lysinibacillus composti TaxID=720633 RepID=A0A3N9UQ87_9BACI|nr:proline racemase family protein [Lysinibacillus composti]MBM7608789.1 proline racemase [Lysinibacillus composti]RQW74692.1 proline racemase [Lysinibacillus composti]